MDVLHKGDMEREREKTILSSFCHIRIQFMKFVHSLPVGTAVGVFMILYTQVYLEKIVIESNM